MTLIPSFFCANLPTPRYFGVLPDYSVWEIFIALTSGACLVLAKPYRQTDSGYLTQLIKMHNITIAGFVPAMLDTILNETEVENLRSLRQVSTGGEELTFELQEKYFGKMSATLYNGYGPTEACIDATYWTCGLDTNDPIIPIGRPLANSKIYILDKHLQIVPVGVPGELCISGVCLARGYLNQPELTAEKFISDPFSQESGARMYKTGDLARYLPDGNIVFLGRKDRQVKIRGFRIELGEIEAALRHCDGVRESLVVVRKRAANKQLVAYVVGTINGLDEQLSQKLPDYMIPSDFVCLDALPLTSNGKIDHRALPAPALKGRERVLPKNALELQLLQSWEQVFNLPSNTIGVIDNFFALGGHSLLAAQLVTQMEKITGIQLSMSILFQAPTVRHLAELLQENWKSPWTYLVPVQPSGSKLPLFLVPPEATTSLCFAKLSNSLGSEQPIYGFDPAGLDGTTAPHTTVEEMATCYLQEMCQLQPTGPYLLGGMCFGAHVAYEMALQLQRQGQSVALLIVLDSGAPASGPSWRFRKKQKNTGTYWRQSKYYLDRAIHHTVNGTLPTALISRFAEYTNKQQRYFRQRTQEISASAQRARLRYVAQPVSCRIALFQSGQYAGSRSKQRWAELAQGGLVYNLYPDTSHISLLEEEDYIQLIAEQLTTLLADL